MSEDLKTPGTVLAAAPQSWRRWFVLVIVAWSLTLTALPYAWGRTLVIGMLVGRPELLPVVGLALGLFAVAALAARLARYPTSAWARRLVASGVFLSWLLVTAVLVWLSVGDLVPKAVLMIAFVAASLWVVWLAWLPYWPLPWSARLAALALFAAASVGFPLLFRAEGLTGDVAVDFAWRWETTPAPPATAAPGPGDTGLALPIRLAAPGPDDYSQFLGPKRLGVLPRARLARDWATHPPRLLWRRPVGAGWSAFAVAGGYAFTQEQRGDQECVVCYRARDGKEAWVHGETLRFDGSMGGPGPRATPTVAEGRVYALGSTGLLQCLDATTGRQFWSVNIEEDFGAQNLAHGVCSSPLLSGEQVLVCPTGKGGPSLAAYDRTTGKRLWSGGSGQASYASPQPALLDGTAQVLVHNASGVAAHDPRTGNVLWSFPWTNNVQVNAAQPIPNAGEAGQVFISTGYGKGCALLEVKRGYAGSWSVQPLWESRAMRSKFATPVVYQGHAYGLDDGTLECMDLAGGEKKWKDGRYGHGQLLLAGDLLLVQCEGGAVVLVEASPEGLHECGRVEALSGKTWNHPALAGRLLLVRNDREAACYELAGVPADQPGD